MFHAMVTPGDLDARNPLLAAAVGEADGDRQPADAFQSCSVAWPTAESSRSGRTRSSDSPLNEPLAIPVTLSTDPRHHFTDNPMLSILAGPFSQWPEPLGLAAIGSEELVREFADIARQEYTAVGIRVALHPRSTCPPNHAGRVSPKRSARTQSSHPDLLSPTSAVSRESAVGQQSVSTMTKHFPGGGAQKDGADPHFSWGREQVYPGGRFDYHLIPFRAAIEAGAAQIMPYYGMPIGTEHEEVGFSFNRSVITGLLREQLGFDGIICTDWGLVIDHPEVGPLGTARAWGVEHLDADDRILKLIDAGVDQLGGEYCTDRLVGTGAQRQGHRSSYRCIGAPAACRKVPARPVRQSVRR